MDQDSALLLFSGIELHVSADEYLPFEAKPQLFLSDRPSQRSHDPDDEKDRKKRRNPFCLSRKRIRARRDGLEEK